MKGSIALFKQALNKCAEAHKANYTDHDGFVTIFNTKIPLQADLKSICEAIFGKRNMVIEHEIGGLYIDYSKVKPLEEVDETTLRLALPFGTELIDDEAAYDEQMEMQAKKDIETINAAMKRLENAHQYERIIKTAGHWHRRHLTDILFQTIIQKGKNIYLHDSDRDESYEEKDGYDYLGKEIDLTNVPDKYRTIVLDNGYYDKIWYGNFNLIHTQEPEKVILDKVAVVDGGIIGVGDFTESVLRINFTRENGEKGTEYHNDYGCDTVHIQDLEKIGMIIHYSEFLHYEEMRKKQEPENETDFTDESELPF